MTVTVQVLVAAQLLPQRRSQRKESQWPQQHQVRVRLEVDSMFDISIVERLASWVEAGQREQLYIQSDII